MTLSLPDHVLNHLERLAARQHTTLIGLVSQTLEELAARDDNYVRARERHLAWLEQAADFGTQGKAMGSRDSLHED